MCSNQVIYLSLLGNNRDLREMYCTTSEMKEAGYLVTVMSFCVSLQGEKGATGSPGFPGLDGLRGDQVSKWIGH